VSGRSLSSAAVIGAALALATLLGLLHLLDPPRRGAPAEPVVPLVDPRHSRLYDPDSGAAVPVAALTVTRPLAAGEESFFFARSGGIWRCVSHFGLVADEGALLGLVQAVLAARFLPHPGDPELDGFGLGPGQRVRLEMHGRDVLRPDAGRDVLFGVDLGPRLPRGGSFARPLDSARVGLLEVDLAEPLRRPAGTLQSLAGMDTPPLVDSRVVPAAWPGFRSGLVRIFVDRSDGGGFELRRTSAPGPIDTAAAPPSWVVIDNLQDGEVPAHPALGAGFALFLGRAPFVRPRDPRSLGSATPTPEARLTLVPAEGELLELQLLPADFGGARTVLNRWTGIPVEVSAEVAQLLVPPTSWLTDPSRGIPWDAYLR
jgi:hypothetical protein